MQDTKRLFAAVKIHPSDEFLKIYNQIKTSLKHERITWVKPTAMHLTIKFFGETAVSKIPAISECLRQAVREVKSFEVKIENTGMFGSRYEPRVIWFGIEDRNAMQELFMSVSGQLKKIGILPDRQNFVPHLTIARIKEIKNKQFFQSVLEQYRVHESGKEIIKELILYESILQRDGPIYKPVEIFRFKESA